MTRTREDVLRLVDEAGVRYIRLCFTDILGKIKGMSITRSELEQVLDEGQGFDGSSVEGFARIDESDLMAIPDPLTFRIIPWEIAGEKIAMMFCDIQNPDGSPYDGDPRWVLKRQLAKLKEKGWTFFVGPELEYFYFENSQEPKPLDQAGYFDYESVDIGTQLRKKTVNALELSARVRLLGWMIVVAVATRAVLYALAGNALTISTLAVWGLLVGAGVVMMAAAPSVAVAWVEWRKRRA